MEACVVICRSRKPADRQGRILFIDAVAEIARERAQSFLRAEHQARILSAYRAFADEPGFAAVANVADVLAAEGNLSIARYVKRPRRPQQPKAPRWGRPGWPLMRKGASSGRAWTRWWTCSMV
jgi:type I restriction enzyme M protein